VNIIQHLGDFASVGDHIWVAGEVSIGYILEFGEESLDFMMFLQET
jgi:hypothetical protein